VYSLKPPRWPSALWRARQGAGTVAIHRLPWLLLPSALRTQRFCAYRRVSFPGEGIEFIICPPPFFFLSLRVGGATPPTRLPRGPVSSRRGSQARADWIPRECTPPSPFGGGGLCNPVEGRGREIRRSPSSLSAKTRSLPTVVGVLPDLLFHPHSGIVGRGPEPSPITHPVRFPRVVGGLVVTGVGAQAG